MGEATTMAPPAALTKVVDIMDKLEPNERARVIETISTFYRGDLDGKAASRPKAIGGGRSLAPFSLVPFSSESEDDGESSQEVDSSPKDFLFAKQPRTDMDRVACLAYYLQNFRNVEQFKTLDLSKLNTEAAQPKFANVASTAKNAVAYKYLVSAGKGYRKLSAPGERYVEALPDYEKAKSDMDAALGRRKRSNSKRSRKSSKSTKKGG